MEKLIVVSGDSHAVPPPEVWPEYLEAQYHDYLPGMREDNMQMMWNTAKNIGKY